MIIQAMIEEGSLTNDKMAEVVNCSSRTISAARTNHRRFGSTKAPYNGRGGRPRSLTDPEVETILDLLRVNPWLHLDEIAVYLGDKFGELRSTSTIGRALKKAGWSKKVARRIAREQCADLRDMYLHDVSAFTHEQLVFVDESGCDTRVGYRPTGWSPLGVTPIQITRFQRGQRFHIIPACTSDGILMY